MTPIETADDVYVDVGSEPALRRLLRFGGTPLLASLTTLFFEHAPTRIASMRAALAAGDAPALELASHSLKSSSAQLGAPALERLCAQVEAHARARALDPAAPLVERMEPALAAFAEWLEGVRATLTQP